jgi:erythromycin esterase-like protein
MWRNRDMADFIERLRPYNDALPAGAKKIGFYGLDLYSLRASMAAVLAYLEKIDPKAADRTRAAYDCLEHLADYARGYGLLGGLGAACSDEAGRGIVELYESRAVKEARRADSRAEEEFFDAAQNARVVKDAEAYYRWMFRSEELAWNVRERHMAETVEDLAAQLDRRGGRAKIVIWAHNSHSGDARATELRAEKQLNVGQLLRQRHARDAVLIGCTTYHGTVTAAPDWAEPAAEKTVRPAHPDSYEAMFHAAEVPRFLLVLGNDKGAPEALRRSRRERSIGVIYHDETPEAEHISHYIDARLARQFDAVLHFDETRAVEPLDDFSEGEDGEAPETYPFGV